MNVVHDAAVVGAGPAGSSAAYFLARRGFDVLLLDKAHFPRDKTCGDGLSPRALSVLDEIGLLPELLSRGRRIRQVQFFTPDGNTLGASFPPHAGLPDYTLVVPRFALDDLIRRQAVSAGARFIGGVNVRGIGRAGRHMEVVGQGGERYLARLVVLATGASLPLLLATGVLRRAPPFMVAARAYYEGIRGLDGSIDFHFDGVPLPGYGWVFPISEDCANVGAGYFSTGLRGRFMPKSPRVAFERFIALPRLRRLLGGADRPGPVKSFPLRVDFASAPTVGEGILLAGEACGLVNPLTGEGIDYALESGQIAAEFAAEAIPRGDLSRRGLQGYDRRLRRKYQRQFFYISLMRDLYMPWPWMIDRLFGLASRRRDLKALIVDIALGHRDAAAGVSPKLIFEVLRGA